MEKGFFTRAAALIFALLMLLSAAFTACGDAGTDDKPAENTASDTAGDETAEVTTTEAVDENIPADLDFGGETINFWYSTVSGSASESYYDMAGDQEGDIVDDAIYKRNIAVEKQLNLTLNLFNSKVGSGDNGTSVRKLIMSGSNEYDLFSGIQWNMMKHVSEGLFYNMIDAPYINIEEPWWATSYINNANIVNSKRFALCGDYNINLIRCAGCMFFNKNLYESYFGDPAEMYQLALDGGWTLDKLIENAAVAYSDLNGDAKVDVDDQFGLLTYYGNNMDILYYAAGGKATEKDENGYPVIVSENALNVQVMEKIYQLAYESDGVYLNKNDPSENNANFSAGKAVYLTGFLYSSEFLRDMKDDYGILPSPKLTEEQSRYYELVHDIVELQFVPNTIQKLDAVSAVLELLAFEGHRTVMPAYYEIALKTKYARDDISIQLVDLIHDSVMTDTAYIYMDDFSSLGYVARGMIISEKKDYVSFTASNIKSARKKLEKLIAAFEEL